jgi:hypothetical protein
MQRGNSTGILFDPVSLSHGPTLLRLRWIAPVSTFLCIFCLLCISFSVGHELWDAREGGKQWCMLVAMAHVWYKPSLCYWTQHISTNWTTSSGLWTFYKASVPLRATALYMHISTFITVFVAEYANLKISGAFWFLAKLGRRGGKVWPLFLEWGVWQLSLLHWWHGSLFAGGHNYVFCRR